MKCENCQTISHSQSTYCGKCGKSLVKEVSLDYNKSIQNILIFFFILLGYIATINFIDFENDYINTLLIDVLFAAIIFVFYFIDFKTINKLLSLKGLKKFLLIKILVGAPLFAIIVSYLAGFLNQSIFDKSQLRYYEQFIDSPAPITLSIISIALIPAIFEEIAFRGILFNHLTKVSRLKSTILISSILFTILHLSLLSALWIFPIGLLFGYFRAKYRSLWYGILGHFMYNGSIVIIEIITFK